MKPKIFIAIGLLIACSNYSKAEVKAPYLQRSYRLPLSISMDLKKSQDAFTDISLTATELHSVLDHFLDETNFLLCIFNAAIVRPIIGFYIALLTHEIVGHGVRALGMGQKSRFSEVEIGFFRGVMPYIPDPDTISYPRASVISFGGNEASYDLSQKIKKRILTNKLTPAYASTYIFSAGNQTFYVYIKESEPGHDLEGYSKDMQMLYGKDYVTMKKLREIGFIDLLDPMLVYSIYSLITNKEFEAPMIPLGPFKILPSIRLILTPYGIEKQLCLDSRIGEYIIKLAISTGETRTIADKNVDAYLNFCRMHRKSLIENHVLFKNLFVYDTQSLPDFDNWTISRNTFGLKLELDNARVTENIALGVMFALWKQPEIFSSTESTKYIDPLLTKIHLGGLCAVSTTLDVHKYLSLGLQAGYKSFGYTNGYNLQSGLILKFTLGLILKV